MHGVAVAAHHAAWNYAILLTGLPLSGLDDWREAAPIASVAQGPDWLTGGAFGPETAIPTMLLVAAAVVVLFRLARRRGRYRAAGEPTPAPSRNLLELVRDIRVPGGEILYDREMRHHRRKKL